MIYKNFYEFLKDHDAVTKYVRSIKHHSFEVRLETPRQVAEIVSAGMRSKKCYGSMISGAFLWGATSENSKFWPEVNKSWKAFYAQNWESIDLAFFDDPYPSNDYKKILGKTTHEFKEELL